MIFFRVTQIITDLKYLLAYSAQSKHLYPFYSSGQFNSVFFYFCFFLCFFLISQCSLAKYFLPTVSPLNYFDISAIK